MLCGLLDFGDLLYPRGVPSSCERGAQPDAQDVLGLASGQQPAAECKYIRIIMFPAVSRRSFIITQRRANARKLVGHNARSDARAVDDDAAQCLATSYHLGHLARDIGIV